MFQKTINFLFLNNSQQKLTHFSNFGTLDPEKCDVWTSYRFVHELVRCSHFTLGNPKKVTFNSIIQTYFWLFTLSHTKTNCNPLAQPTWKCHHTCELMNCKTFSSDWRFVVRVPQNVGGSEKNQLWCVATGINVRASVQSDHLLH